RLIVPMRWVPRCRHSTHVPHVGAPVRSGIRIQAFLPAPRLGHADAVSDARHGRHIADNQCGLPAMATQKSEYAVVLVVSDDPGKASRDSVAAMQCRRAAV